MLDGTLGERLTMALQVDELVTLYLELENQINRLAQRSNPNARTEYAIDSAIETQSLIWESMKEHATNE